MTEHLEYSLQLMPAEYTGVTNLKNCQNSTIFNQKTVISLVSIWYQFNFNMRGNKKVMSEKNSCQKLVQNL